MTASKDSNPLPSAMYAAVDKTTLENLLTRYDWWMGVSTAAVAVGILGEYVAHFVFEKEARKSKLEIGFTILFGVLVFGGVAGEYVLGKQVSQAASQIQQIADSETAQSNERAEQLRIKADGLEEQLLEQGPRSVLLYGKREEDFLGSIREFSGQKVQVRICKFDDNEIRDTAERLTTLFRSAGWAVSPNSPNWGESNCLFVRPNEPTPSGIWIGTPSDRPSSETRARAQELVRFLSQIPLAATLHRVGKQTARADASRASIDEDYGNSDSIVVTILEHAPGEAASSSLSHITTANAVSGNSGPPSLPYSNSGKAQTGDHVMASLLAPLVSFLSAIVAIVYYYKNLQLSRSIADRVVTIEAQKLLLEINKQFVSDPDLLAVYDDHPKRDELLGKKAGLAGKIEALGYMKLNIFELVFAVLPKGVENNTWVAYFRDSLSRCSVLREELAIHPTIYHPNLLTQYESWKRASGSTEKPGTDNRTNRVPSKSLCQQNPK